MVDRGRGRAARKRATLLPSSQDPSFSDSPRPSTPAPSSTSQRTPNTLSPRGIKATMPHRASSPPAEPSLRATPRSDRPARSATFHSSFSLESASAPGPAVAAGLSSVRKRPRLLETVHDDPADDDAHSKGGHSLRKRARIDYTQEMIDDDVGVPATKSDLAPKANSTPSARGRKRRSAYDGSDDESDDFSSNPKRRRPDTPAPVRAGLSRRRNPSKKPAADVGAFVDQPSDNDVQDTILVSVSVNGGQPSEQESESPLRDAESRPISSDEGDRDASRAQGHPLTPEVQPHATEDAVAVALEDAAEIDNVLVSEQAEDKAQIPPAHVSLTPESKQPEPASEAGGTRTTLEAVTAELQHPTTPQASETGLLVEAGPDRQNLQEQQPREAAPEVAAAGAAVEIPESALSPTAESKPVGESTAVPVSQRQEDAAPKPTFSRIPSQQASKPTGPTRLTNLERIYNLETPFASHMKLAPYEDEDIVLPGSYTEWVYPVDNLKKSEPTPTPIPTPTPTPSAVESKDAEIEWDGTRRLKTSEFFALYRQETRRREQAGEPPISMIEFNNQCARRYKSSQSQATDSATPTSSTAYVASPTVAVQDPDTATAAPELDSPPDSQTADPKLPTTSHSPGPAEDGMGQEDGVEEEQDSEELLDAQVKPDGPVEPIEVIRNPPKQYLFPKIRDPSEFVKAFEGWQNMDAGRLYDTVAATVEALHSYQQEYNELRKILDDEENAKRRQANDKTIINWENRQKADEPQLAQHLRRHFDDVVKGPIPFEVRGVRAPKPYIDDPVLEHQRDEDRIMAQAYGFKHNNHPTLVGRQNPEEQRWEMPENRLRRRTEKGAELAEENVIEGKRARKPRYVSDQIKDLSRPGTPIGTSALGQGRRQRRRPGAAPANVDDTEGPEPTQPTESFSESPRKGRAARSRGAVLDDQPQIAPVVEADNNLTEDEGLEMNHKTRGPRRRGRGVASLPEPPTSAPRHLRGLKGLQANHQAAPEIASSSFYSNASTMATQPESRPSTASSEATAHTAETTESTYSLREKRKRNFALENDPELEPRTKRRARGVAAQKTENIEPKKRPQRKKGTPGPAAHPPSPPLQPVAPKAVRGLMRAPAVLEANDTTQGPTPFLHTFNAAPAFPPGAPPPPPPPPAIKKPITRIKIVNSNGLSAQGGSRTAEPANGASGSGSKSGTKGSRGNKSASSADGKAGSSAGGSGDFEKPYAEMTKSEKMSWSMRRRWASGEMQGAVEKRRNTLANKKAEKAASNSASGPADSNVSGQAADSGSATASDPTTPVPVTDDQPPAQDSLPMQASQEPPVA